MNYLASKNSLDSVRADDFINDLSYTLSSRSQLSWRASCTAGSIDDLVDALPGIQAVKCGNPPSSLSFVFTGQGAQWLGMGVSLFQFSVYRESLEVASDYLRDVLGAEWNAIGKNDLYGTPV